MPDVSVCPISGLQMVRDIRPFTLTYKGHERTFPMPGWYCDESGESIFTRQDMKVSDRHLAILKGEVENLAGPEEVVRFRKRFRLSQAEAGAILGGGPRAFQKYESGEVLASRPMTNLLRLVSRHPEELDHIASDAKAPERRTPSR